MSNNESPAGVEILGKLTKAVKHVQFVGAGTILHHTSGTMHRIHFMASGNTRIVEVDTVTVEALDVPDLATHIQEILDNG
jgi:hypothetical protein